MSIDDENETGAARQRIADVTGSRPPRDVVDVRGPGTTGLLGMINGMLVGIGGVYAVSASVVVTAIASVSAVIVVGVLVLTRQ
ncbi:hypothetical protein [Catenuloplanes japonicus]|uniref:hypothetical protein n=1 Tax=Catenuloplanes japonicus TaxID=33876 RepID=UPI000524FB74|nr:hypothetical protein [Catenuloplanes japonicus]